MVLLTIAGINFKNPDSNISTGVGGPCPVGHYCPEGTSLPSPCPLGTFSNRYRITGSNGHTIPLWVNEQINRFFFCLYSLYVTKKSGCTVCPAGQFCGSVGLSRPSGPCREGFYCPAGASSSTGATIQPFLLIWTISSLSVCILLLTVVLWLVQVLILKVVSVLKRTSAPLAVPCLFPALRALIPTWQDRLSALPATLDTIAQRVPANTLCTPALLDSTALKVRDKMIYKLLLAIQKNKYSNNISKIVLFVKTNSPDKVNIKYGCTFYR